MSSKSLFQIYIIITSLCIIFSCKTKKVENTKSNPMLENCWTHAYEEDDQEMKVYRPCDYKTFPPSRYRHKFTLSAANQATYFVLSPTDGHHDENGKWQYNDSAKSLIIKTNANETVKKYEVVELSADKMMLKELY